MTSPRMLGDRYEVGAVLGSGGMAEVHRGRDIRLGRAVAIKILRSDLARDPSFLTRFRREAQASASLNHPSIVAVYDTGEDPTGPTPYIVMEFVNGRTLRDVLRSEGHLAPRRAIEITAEICAALDFSHRGGIIHRDVKPGNVMITEAGAVKVMDFGIARAVTDSAATITSTAQVIGTAQYLSPEQARGETVDARSDVYSTGCLLYELLAGQPPFTGDSPVAIAYQHVREDPVPPSTRNPQVPEELDRIVLTAMAKSPERRYQTAGDMRADLQRALAGRPVNAPPPGAFAQTAVVGTSTGPASVLAGGPPTGATTTYGADDAKRRRRQRALGFGLLALGVIAIFVAAAIFVPRLFEDKKKGTAPPTSSSVSSSPPSSSSRPPSSSSPPSTTPSRTRTTPPVVKVDVPNLIGGTVKDAQQQLAAVGLRLGTKTPRTSDDDRTGLVIDQQPKTGSVVKGSAVDIVFGTGRATTTVPFVNGLSVDDAQGQLRANGLVTTDPITRSDKSAAGTVLDSRPQQGKAVRKGDTVTLIVSTGKIPLPSTYGETVAKATDRLRRDGFTNVTTVEQESGQEPGTVIGQDPAPGNQAEPDSEVTLTIAKAPPTSSSPPSSAPSSATSSKPPASSESSSSPSSKSSSPPPGFGNPSTPDG
jgi:eukaryotic-like serine/threonine-protein kinase